MLGVGRHACVHESRYRLDKDLHFHSETAPAVRAAIQAAFDGRKRLRIWYGDIQTGKAWPSEYDVTGRIGRSTGRFRVPLLIRTARSLGGGAILDHCIIRVDDMRTRTSLYRHANFDAGCWRHVPGLHPHHPFEVALDDGLVAQFRRKEQAIHYIAFMKGERYAK